MAHLSIKLIFQDLPLSVVTSQLGMVSPEFHGLLPTQIDTVFLTGGTSRIPHIRTLFAERFGQNKLENRDAFTSVAHGLGSSVPLFV